MQTVLPPALLTLAAVLLAAAIFVSAERQRKGDPSPARFLVTAAVCSGVLLLAAMIGPTGPTMN